MTLRPTELPAAELRGVAKRYGKQVALDGVDLELRTGQVTALLGPNGAGKTTAVKLFLGILRPDRGRALLLGGDPRSAKARMRVGAMMQISGVPETLRVREHVELFSAYYPSPMPLADALDAAGLNGLEDRLYGKLSGGEKQRLMFALALCGNPDLLFLDEPTVGLDAASRRAFWSHVRDFVAGGRSVLLTTHYLEEADALADRVVVLTQGRVLTEGSPDEIKARASARRVRCATRLEAAEVASWPGIREVQADRLGLDILTGDAERIVRRLLAADPDLQNLQVSSVGLEDAFLHLTAPGHDDLEQGAA